MNIPCLKVSVFNPLEHGIRGAPLMVPASLFNKLAGLNESAFAIINAISQMDAEDDVDAIIPMCKKLNDEYSFYLNNGLSALEPSNPTDQRAGAPPAPMHPVVGRK